MVQYCDRVYAYMQICSKVYCDRVYFLCTERIATGQVFDPQRHPPPVHMKVECPPPPPPGLVTGNQIRNVRKNTLCKCKQHYCVVTLQFWKKKKKKHLVSLTFMYKSDHGALLWKFATFYFDIQHNLIVLRTFHAKQSWQIMYQWKIK